MDGKVNQTIVKHLRVMEGVNPVTGLMSDDFNRNLYFEAASSTSIVSVYEVDSINSPGLYRVQFVPDATGSWCLSVKSKDYGDIPQLEVDLQVSYYDCDDLYSLVTNTAPGGIVLVGNDYGGQDNLRYVDLQGTGLAGADVRAYSRSDYESGNLGASYILSNTRTDIEGRLTSALTLSPGYWYKIVYVIPGRESDVKELFVSEV